MIIILFSLIFTILLTHFWIKKLKNDKFYLHQKKYGPNINNISKGFTPSMGGVVFLFVFICLYLFFAFFYKVKLYKSVYLIYLPLSLSLVGFYDDYLKYSNKSSEGFTSLKKLFLQILAVVPWIIIGISLNYISILNNLELNYFINIFVSLLIVIGVLNAVNITDGLDGLAGSLFLISITYVLWKSKLDFSLFLCIIINIGIMLGFLWYNCNPADIFMGDTGAHFLGGILVVITFMNKNGISILSISFVYIIEIITVVIQLFYIYILKKKLFLMSPIHHHFQLIGWKENKIVIRFILIHICGIVALDNFITFILERWYYL